MSIKPKVYDELEKLSKLAPIPFYWTDEIGTIVGLNRSAFDLAKNQSYEQFKPKQEDEPTTNVSRHITLISAEILEVLTEKKYEYSKLPVDFTYNISQSGYFAFINVDVRAFKRMLSNLINNAVDALDGSVGEVKISMDVIDNETKIIVTDNDKGMLAQIKEKILNNIIEKSQVKRSILVTSHHNNKEVRQLTLSSQTRILPKPLASVIPINISVQAATQMQPQLETAKIVFVDDDINLLDAIMEFVVKDSCKVDRYHTAAEFLNHVTQYPKDTKFLLDNQYKNEDISGLELADKLHSLGYTNLYLFSSEYFGEYTIIPEYLKIIAKNNLVAINKLIGSI